MSFPSVVNSEDFRIDDPKMGSHFQGAVEILCGAKVFFMSKKKYNSVQSSSSKLNLISSKLTNLNVTREKNAVGGKACESKMGQPRPTSPLAGGVQSHMHPSQTLAFPRFPLFANRESVLKFNMYNMYKAERKRTRVF